MLIGRSFLRHAKPSFARSVSSLDVSVPLRDGNTLAATKIASSSSKNTASIIMVSGKSMTKSQWRTLDNRLAEAGFNVIIFDQRDMGLSSKYPLMSNEGSNNDVILEHHETQLLRHSQGKDYDSAYTLEDCADDLRDIMDYFDLASAHILGLSLGGVVSQIAAIKNPDRIKSLTCIMSSCNPNRWAAEAYTCNPEFFHSIMHHPKPTEDMSRKEYLQNRVEIWQQLLTNKETQPDLLEEEIQLLEEELGTDYDRGGVDWLDLGGMRQTLAMASWSDKCPPETHALALGQLNCSTLVLHGVHDQIFPIEAGEELAKVSGGCLLKFPGGHNTPLDLLEEITDAIVEHVTNATRQ